MAGFYYFYFSIFIPATKLLRSQRSSGSMAVIIFRKHMTFLTVLQMPFPEVENEETVQYLSAL